MKLHLFPMLSSTLLNLTLSPLRMMGCAVVAVAWKATEKKPAQNTAKVDFLNTAKIWKECSFNKERQRNWLIDLKQGASWKLHAQLICGIKLYPGFVGALLCWCEHNAFLWVKFGFTQKNAHSRWKDITAQRPYMVFDITDKQGWNYDQCQQVHNNSRPEQAELEPSQKSCTVTREADTQHCLINHGNQGQNNKEHKKSSKLCLVEMSCFHWPDNLL